MTEVKEDKYYLRVTGDVFGFVIEGETEILETDKPITLEDHRRFIKENEKGKQYKVKEVFSGIGLFDYLEEFIPTTEEAPPSEAELLKQRIELLENENADLLLDSVNKDMRIEQNETDIADLLLVVGGM